MIYSRYCKQCKAKFQTDFPTKVYCNELCKRAAYIKKVTNKPKKLPKVDCLECGSEFQMRVKTSKFCTQLCKTTWENKNYLNLWKEKK